MSPAGQNSIPPQQAEISGELNSQLKLESSTQSQSIGAVRWNLPEEDLQAHSSAPTSPRKSSAPSTHRSSQHPHQNGMKNLRSLQECVHFINHWKEQVAQVCKSGSDAGKGTSKGETPVELKTERSLEESRKLIVLWANELNSVDKARKKRILTFFLCVLYQMFT
ncbi:unnamed protein product [Oncorhynchus mykiss]|uniref:Uncharacterized protein n=1 Tax=Oncorhynchus mykiss TaxID=8022 RepID=A0A060XG25_ONCMY|nr:unnamed protein product [Oncorhynchus mykiss]